MMILMERYLFPDMPVKKLGFGENRKEYLYIHKVVVRLT